jgi:putative membrane protein
MGGMMGIGLGGWGLLFMFLFWGGLIALAVWLVSILFPRGGQEASSSGEGDFNAHEILDQRYVRGEITREQYELMKQDLG